MKLISITNVGSRYEVKALIVYKFLGFQLYSHDRFFFKNENEEDWSRLNSQKKVSFEEQRRLDKWLSDHQKFLEKK